MEIDKAVGNQLRKSDKDFSSHTKESILMIGSIQSQGVLLVLQEPELKILQVSNNTFEYLGYHPEKLLQKNLDILFRPAQIENLNNYLSQVDLQTINPIKLSLKVAGKFVLFDGILHRSDGKLVLELEPTSSKTVVTFIDFYYLIKLGITKLNRARNIKGLCEIAASEIHKLTKFDRVMVYKFDSDGSGEVVAESKNIQLNSFLGLHFPSWDIPQTTKEIAIKNKLRLIADINAPPVPIIPADHPLDGTPLNLSLSVLRSSPECHRNYLKNMGVTSSLVMSLIKEEKLWGVIACHNYTPKLVSYEVRAACEFFAQSMSLELSNKDKNEDYDYKIKLKSIQSELLSFMSQEESFVEGLIKYKPNLLDLVNATGAVIYLGEDWNFIGKTPSREEVESLIIWLEQRNHFENFFYTDSLANLEPKNAIIKDVASGVLGIRISKEPTKYILWFREEKLQTVNWAGQPEQEFKIDENGQLISCPRKSFADWEETVRFKSLAWKPCEIEAALNLKKSITKIILRTAEELAQLNKALRDAETREREKANKLAGTLKELQYAQAQLIQSEKMSSLGQLVAGIAHEINNPISFIHGNLRYADEYARKLLSLVNLYNRYYPQPEREITEKIEEMDWGFLAKDLPKLIDSMKIGTNRIQDIVKSLRNFSRIDEIEKKPVDIHNGIDSTLLILGHRLKSSPERPEIIVEKNYGHFPEILCNLGQLNQVFMNILANSLDALEEQNQGRSYQEIESEPNIIKIITKQKNDFVLICISDNGPGIPQEIQSRIFDPFFTTKPVGKGTGLGLSISYQIIVEKHQGKLSSFSSPQKGTEFTIEIPLQLTSKS